MPFYHRLGQIPHKRHTQFKKPDGKLYREELMGLKGFESFPYKLQDLNQSSLSITTFSNNEQPHF